MQASACARLHLGEHPALEREVLEHRLDDHVRALEARVVGRRGDPREHLSSSPRRSSAGAGRARRGARARAPAPARTEASSRSLMRTGSPALLRGDEGDAAAHQAAAEHRRPCCTGRAFAAIVHAGVLLQRGGGEEELAEPARSTSVDQQLAEGAGLGAQAGLAALLHALADDLQGALRRRVVAAGLPEQLLARLGEEEPPPERVPLERGAGSPPRGGALPVRPRGGRLAPAAPAPGRARTATSTQDGAAAPPRPPGRACAPCEARMVFPVRMRSSAACDADERAAAAACRPRREAARAAPRAARAGSSRRRTATRPWQASAHSRPPPRQAPWMAATTGLGNAREPVEPLLALARGALGLGRGAERAEPLHVGAGDEVLLAGGEDDGLHRRVLPERAPAPGRTPRRRRATACSPARPGRRR